jgi:hypothetical protein
VAVEDPIDRVDPDVFTMMLVGGWFFLKRPDLIVCG